MTSLSVWGGDGGGERRREEEERRRRELKWDFTRVEALVGYGTAWYGMVL